MHRYYQYNTVQHVNYDNKVLIDKRKIKPLPNNWEWSYDFKDIWKYLLYIINIYIDNFCLKLIRKRDLFTWSCETTYSLNSVELQDIEQYLYEAVRNQHKTLMYHKCMIVYGPDVRQELLRVTKDNLHSSPFRFQINIKEQHKIVLFYYDIPLYFAPTISGVHVLPDLTGEWSEKIEVFEDTTFNKFRY